jgi:PD-(D/E)XK endonuclease
MAGEAPSAVGARAELAVATGLVRGGFDVFTPFFNAHARIDLVAVGAGGLLRVQVKTARRGSGFLCFATCSHTGRQQHDYRGQVDAFGVYSPELNSVYLVPVNDVPLRRCHLRLEPSRNNQASKIRWAADYLIGPP